MKPGTLGLLPLLIALALLAMLDSAAASSHQRLVKRVRVRTVCQGNTLTLSCHRGYRIHILAAFYGRASSRICPSVLGGHAAHRGGGICASRRALAVVQRDCEGRPKCQLLALSSVFGNPCHHRRKYLRVRYACRFGACQRVASLQDKLLRLIARYARLAATSFGYWRRQHFRHRQRRLEKKLNHLRRKFHSCFKCKRGCAGVRKLLARLKRAKARVAELLLRMTNKTHKSKKRWHASRWLLRRKLNYLHARQRVARRRLRKCMRVCHY